MKMLSCESVPVPFPAGVERCVYESGVDGARDSALLLSGTRADWIVVIHGHGSHEDQLYARPDIRERWLPALRATGAGILTPNLRGNAWMSPAATRDLRDLLAWVRTIRGARRFFFFSGSMGGTSNLYYALQHPEDVTALAALGAAPDPAPYAVWCRSFPDGSIQRQIGDAIEQAYGGPPETHGAAYSARAAPALARRLAMPLFFAHGECDALMPVSEARRFSTAMGNARSFLYKELTGGGHDSPLFLPAAFDWLAEQVAQTV